MQFSLFLTLLTLGAASADRSVLGGMDTKKVVTNSKAVEGMVDNAVSMQKSLTVNGRKKLLAKPDGAALVAKIDAAAAAIPEGGRSLAEVVRGENSCSTCNKYMHTGSSCYSNCKSCGFSTESSLVDNDYDCIACDDGYTLDVYFTDCTGKCLATGSSISDPVSSDSCAMPCAVCGYPYHPWAETNECDSGTQAEVYSGDEICYDGSGSTASCRTCGFYSNSASAGGSNDCVSCEDDFEIDVQFSDCTGTCVPIGEALNPIAENTCRMPAAACGGDYDGFVTPTGAASMTAVRGAIVGLSVLFAAAALMF